MPDIRLDNVTYKYGNNVVGIENVSLHLPSGKRIALLGANGAGKTTLLMLLTAILKPTEGKLIFNDKPYQYNRKGLKRIRKEIGFLFQNPDHQLFTPTVFEELAFGLTQVIKDKSEIEQKVKKGLYSFNLYDLKDLPPHKLSTGQKKRVAMASVLVMDPNLLICDEPTSSLDPNETMNLFGYFDEINSKGTTILISTHNVEMAYEWADIIVVLKEGKVAAVGETENIMTNRKMLTECGLRLPLIVEINQAISHKSDVSFPNKTNKLIEFLQTNKINIVKEN